MPTTENGVYKQNMKAVIWPETPKLAVLPKDGPLYPLRALTNSSAVFTLINKPTGGGLCRPIDVPGIPVKPLLNISPAPPQKKVSTAAGLRLIVQFIPPSKRYSPPLTSKKGTTDIK